MADGAPDFLYRGLTTADPASLLTAPLAEGSHWGSYRMAEYFAYQALDDRPGEEPVILAVPLAEFDQALLEPDLEMARDLVFDEDVADGGFDALWKASAKTWRDSLACYDAVVYRGTLTLRREHVVVGEIPAEGPSLP